MMEQRWLEANIVDIFQPTKILEINALAGHDLWIKTKLIDREAMQFDSGQTARIYSWQGSMNFGDLHDQFQKILKDEDMLNKNKLIEPVEIDITKAEKAEVVEYVADHFLLTVYRHEAGYIGIQTAHSDYEDVSKGPVVWLRPCQERFRSSHAPPSKTCPSSFRSHKKSWRSF